jgi:hypothetical protein
MENDTDNAQGFSEKSLAEKISALNSTAYFEKRRAKGDRKTYRRILNRKSGECPRLGDER